MNYVGVQRNSKAEFYHYGRLGMKWYQHIFGSDKASGVRRKKKRTSRKVSVKEKAKADAKKAKTMQEYAIENRRKEIDSSKKKGSLASISDEELARRIKRMQDEKTYRDLLRGEEMQTSSPARKMIETAVMKSGQDILNQVTYYAFAMAVNDLTKGITPADTNLVKPGGVKIGSGQNQSNDNKKKV